MSVQIHGKTYITVAERIKEAGSDLIGLDTQVLQHEPTVIKATVTTKKGTFTGISSANPSKLIEKENPYEVAETSAVGRALGFAGYGVIDSIASADEVATSSRPTQATTKAPTTTDRQVAQLEHFCTVHQRDMKLRIEQDGQVYDHRLIIDGVWNKCFGQKWIPQATFVKEVLPERDINEE